LTEPEHVDALPVLAEVSEVRPVDPGPQSLVQRIAALPAPAVAAAGGFLVGVATFVLFRMRHPRGRKVRVGGGGRGGKKIEIAESRSFLVDIHLLKR
jgi:hypothetical protein